VSSEVLHLTIPNDQHDFIVNTLSDQRENLVDTMKTVSSDSDWFKECDDEIARIDGVLATLACQAIADGRFFLKEGEEDPVQMMLSIEGRQIGIEERVSRLEGVKSEVEKLRSRLAHEKWSNRSKTISHNKLIKDFHFALDEISARKKHCLEAHSCCLEVS
jgi:hypothetical protein